MDYLEQLTSNEAAENELTKLIINKLLSRKKFYDDNEEEQSFPKLLSRKQVAKMIGVKENTLASWACSKRYSLKYIKVGRLVKYRHADVLEFLESRSKCKIVEQGRG